MEGAGKKVICPHCGGEGSTIGTPCSESVCRKQGYHYIPEAHAQAVHGSDGPGVAVDPQIGRRIDRYLLVGTIGHGGMGSVYLALQLPLERPVALKMVSGVTLDETSQGRFEREAKAISMLYHPNIVQLYEYGFNPATGAPFMALEYVKGGRELMDEMVLVRARGETWPASRLQRIFGQVLSALQTAHSQKLVHRDIKPQNIMLVDIEGNVDFVKILDFGLARTLSQVPGMDRLTGTGTVVGTPQYMAPEQLIGATGDVDHRSDLYCVGAVIYEIVTGMPAYPGQDPRAVIALKLDGAYDPVGRLPGDYLKGEMRAFLGRAVARDPGNRFGSAVEMREALAASLADMPEGRFRPPEAGTLEMARPVTSADRVDAEAATLVSDDVMRPKTEQLSAFERQSIPGSETLETAVDVPGKVPGRIVAAGALTGVALVAVVLAVVFLVLPRMRSDREPDAGTGETRVGKGGATGESLASDASGSDAGASSPVWEMGAIGAEGFGKKIKHRLPVTPADAGATLADDASTAVAADPAPDPGAAAADDPGAVDAGQPGAPDQPPPILSTPPMKLIHEKLKALTPEVKKCLDPPQGQVTVGVVISSATGKAGKVKVSGFFSGGEQVKGCVRDAVMTIEVPAFEGSDVGVPYTYTFGSGGEVGDIQEELPETVVAKKLEKARGWLSACAGDIEGKATVQIKVSGTSGRITDAKVIDGPFAGTQEGACMEKALEKVVVFPVFAKDEAVYTHTYQLP